MLKTLSIRNFRGFEQFEMHDLGRVNLLVGTNNSGKTSVLEAIELLCSHGYLPAIWEAASRRGEVLMDAMDGGRPEISVRHLFHGHELAARNTFSIEARRGDGAESLTAVITAAQNGTTKTTPPPTIASRGERSQVPTKGLESWEHCELDRIDPWRDPLDLELLWKGKTIAEVVLRLTEQGGAKWGSVRGVANPTAKRAPKAIFVTTASLTADEAVAAFDGIVLTREETFVVDALRIIEPTIERLAATVAPEHRTFNGEARGGLFVKCTGLEQRIPIGSMGDGIWRMLGLALALARAENGVLLVDEIDTGLHFTVMVDMWKMVAATAERLGVQVFATTHSRDCYESLAAIAHDTVSEGSNVTIQRIEREKGRAVPYTEQEIVAAAERGIEVR